MKTEELSLDEMIAKIRKDNVVFDRLVDALQQAISHIEWWCETYETETETEMQETLEEQKFQIKKILEG